MKTSTIKEGIHATRVAKDIGFSLGNSSLQLNVISWLKQQEQRSSAKTLSTDEMGKGE